MSTAKIKGPVIEQGLCRCCGYIKRCRILNVEYHWQGHKEVYSDMFMDCFGLMLSHLEGEERERVICATCVSRLRDAAAFKSQVLQCENTLLKTSIHVHGFAKSKLDLKNEVKVESLEAATNPNFYEVLLTKKEEEDAEGLSDAVDTLDHDDLDDSDHKPVIELKTQRKKRLKTKLGTRVRERRKTLKKVKEIKIKTWHENIEPLPKPQRPRMLETEMKTLSNTVTIVENSYVCPFYTSFSDYYCIYCRDTFTEPGRLREHTAEHDPKGFKDILYQSKKLAQIDILKIDCRLCPQQITDIETLKEHLLTVHDKTIHPITNEFLKFKLTSTLTCTECSQTFKFFHALKKHMAEHFGTCICDVCGAHYFDERILLIHQKKHQENKTEIHSCSYCERTFKSRHNRYLHEAKVHKKEAAYPCSKCDEIFFTQTLRYRHMIDTHGEERTYPCDQCGRVYDSRKSLREHNRRSHLKIMKHQCDICDRRFYLPSRLREHMSTHTGERNYRCDYCGKSYPRLRGLKVHMHSHNTEKNFRCMLCNASFTQNVNLKNHMKRQHHSLDLEDDYQSGLMLNAVK